MYRIKAKPGYNVIIRDLGITFSSGGGWIKVDKKKFDNSKDAKRMTKFLIIEEIDIQKEKKINNNILPDDNIPPAIKTIFVTRPAFEENPKDVFVAQPKGIDEIPIIEEIKKIEEVIAPVEEAKIETVEEIKVEAVETTEAIEGTILDDDMDNQTTIAEVSMDIEATTEITDKIKDAKKPGRKGNKK